MKKYNILLTCAGGGLSSYIINFFKYNSKFKDLKIIAIDNRSNIPGKYFADYFEKVPRGDSKNYITKIKKIIKKYNINLIIPGSDEEALNLSKNILKIKKKNLQIACVNYETLKIISSKIETYKFLGKHGFKLPIWKYANNQSELLKEVNFFIELKKDFIIKPSSTRGGRNVSVIKFSRENKKLINKSKKKFINKIIRDCSKKFPILLSEKLNEPIYDFDLLAWGGKLIKGVIRKRVNAAEPNDGHTIIKNDKILKQGKKIVKLFNLSWLYDCDFMFDKKGNPVVIEINPRASGSASVSVAAGISLFDDIISLARNKNVKKQKTPFGTKIIAYKSLKKIK